MTSKLENCDKSASSKSDKSTAPDGGFGWLIVIAYGTANVSFIEKKKKKLLASLIRKFTIASVISLCSSLAIIQFSYQRFFVVYSLS
jgi:hypothetical protein